MIPATNISLYLYIYNSYCSKLKADGEYTDLGYIGELSNVLITNVTK